MKQKKRHQSSSQTKSKQAHSGASDLSSRAVAVKIVQDCIESGQSLSNLLPRYLEPLKLEARPLAQEISFGVLRWYYRLNPLLASMLSKPLRGKKKSIHYLLLAGLYQLIYLDKVDYAIVDETVNACDELQQSWAKGLVNAILRRFLREKDSLIAELDKSYASRFAYPDWLINAIKNSWKKSIAPSNIMSLDEILTAGNQRPPMTLRINQQFDLSDYLQRLAASDIAFSSMDSDAYHRHTVILDKPIAVDKLPLFAEGGVSVQDAAPQLAAQLLSPQPGDRILDACAAPGGKTMHLFEQQALLSEVVALDVSQERLSRVSENSQRLKVPAEKLRLISGDASQQDWWDGEMFERILLDAPCSATGVIRRHPDIKVLRREEDIAALVLLQGQILRNLWSMLKPGGVLLYATCSILRDENDRQIQAFLAQQDDASEINIIADWGYAMPVGRQILPDSQRVENNDVESQNMDGFYYALLSKQAEK
ncbi:16S rRNA (cytosine(967)-C(5))-methyltransferase RsmB [sulfur-oxidizing endosymbiont of Gigantopelta aegis]|uniref:16S rRNA (cytosine(967)-C(5))-methyltransferase RsmB n=1 Tax=sulfur-oxidizing endosymbiont of Gigantopelta aegis TaxID=2794934 RepID=UPI0018DAFD58|nr:16S rRNA (cytosine(967)-C(5))-methyltransferase RsmB [sulfur-oxidizing endosymbiont of Gigantopelta aegis]